MPEFIGMQKISQLIPSPEALKLIDAMMSDISDEIYIIDTMTMRFEYANVSALKNSGYSLESLRQQTINCVLGLEQKLLQAHVNLHRQHAEFSRLQMCAPMAGDINKTQLHVMVMRVEQKELTIVIKHYDSLTPVPMSAITRKESQQELNEIEARFHAMVSNIPGLFFQFQLDSNKIIKFIYVSEGCQALLGMTAEELKNNPQSFYSLMNANDRASLDKRLVASKSKVNALDWEGRVWIDNWQDNKWVNVRAIPRVLNEGVIQWEGIMINITQSKNEKHEIEQSRRELAELTAHMHKIKEHERTIIAREIHDDLGGNLTAVKIGLASIIKRLSSGEEVPVTQVKGLEFIIDNTFEAVHRISSDLRPNILDLGIVAALEWQVVEFEKHVAIPCKFKCSETDIPVSQDQAIALFRICQESMSNIAKHAQASKVTVDLTLHLSEIVMTISDNGIGIKSDDTYKANSFGLRGMQERVMALHGALQIDRSSKRGTAITVRLPIE